MAIDISEDLIIATTLLSTETQTIENLYDIGSPAGTYLPGKDFSATDDVSKGVVTSYRIGISLTSKSGQTYPIDKLFLQSVNDPRTNGTGIIPFYYINTNPDPQDITDDNQYTPVANYVANMTSVVLDQNAGVTSTSTVNLTMNVNYPQGVYWKTKIAPQIQVVALKDGINAKSDIFKPLEVRMSSIAQLQTDFYRLASEWGAIRLANNNSVSGFYVPFYMQTNKITPANTTTLLDSPEVSTIVYSADLTYTIDGTPINVSTQNLSVSLQSGTGVSIQDFSVTSNQLNITLNKTGDITLPITLRIVVFLPYDPGDKNNVTMAMQGVWNADNDGGVKYNDFVNSYIFTQDEINGINASQVIPLKFTQTPFLQDWVEASNTAPNNSINSYFRSLGYEFYSVAGSKLMLLLDSEVANISDSPKKVTVTYVKPGDISPSTYTPPDSAYIQQYGYAPLPAGYDPTTICYSVFDGGITLGTYQDIIAGGNIPNILLTTLLEDVLAGLNIDYAQPFTIRYQDADILTIPSTDFKALYDANPSQDFTGRLYTSVRIGTNFASVADANTQYGPMLAAGDRFIDVSGKVFLDLSTRKAPASTVVNRFNTNSIVRSNLTILNYFTNFITAITDDNVNPITNIFDYSRAYNLRMHIVPPPGSGRGFGTFLQNTEINFNIPSAVLPYIYIVDNPAFYSLDPVTQIPTLIATVTNYSLSPAGIKIVVPTDIFFSQNVYLNVPIKFLLPSQNILFSHNPTTFDPNRLILNQPGVLVDGFSAATAYYKANMTYADTTLQSAGVDFTGLTVNKNFYPNGTPVNFIATVKNESNTANSIYMAMTVPTNQYNPIETSNNTQLAFIDKITAFDPTTVIYYQTASQATPADIAAMKEINQPGTNLQTYYNSVIVNSWTLYTPGDVLPADVVMLVAYTPNVPQGVIVRVDYEVTVQMDVNTTDKYINNAAFNYYSTASGIESQSNIVTIQNFNINDKIPIVKAPATQTINGAIGTQATFTITFTAPPETAAFSSLTFTDQLPKALALQAGSTIKIGNNPAVPFDGTMNTDKLVTKVFTNTGDLAGQPVIITLVTAIDQPNNIPISLADTNQANLIINGDPNLTSSSNIVEVIYTFTDLFNIHKLPLTQNHPKEVNEQVEFQIYFDVPADVSNITSMVIKDVLADALSYDAANSVLQIGDSFVEPLNATVTGNTVEINFDKIPLAAGKTVKITLGTILSDVSKLPADGIIQNNATLTINNIPAYSFTSNIVTATFGAVITPIPIAKAPAMQEVNSKVGEPVSFELSFTIPQNVTGYNSITVTDTLNDVLAYVAAGSTIKIGVTPAQPLNATVIGNSISKTITNFAANAGELVVITINAIVNDISKIPANNQITNMAQLTVNNDLTLVSNSNTVIVKFNPILAPVKTADTKTYPIAQDKNINFSITYYTADVGDKSTTITITDTIDPNLTITGYGLVGIAPSANITIVDATVGNTIKFIITTNYPVGSGLSFPTSFKLNIATHYTANTVTDENYVIKNSSTIQIGTEEPLVSNIVRIEPTVPREQAINDLLESVALQEAAIAHILNAEGEKIQKVVAMDTTTKQLLQVNNSVSSMVNAIFRLETVLQGKIEMFDNCLCIEPTDN